MFSAFSTMPKAGSGSESLHRSQLGSLAYSVGRLRHVSADTRHELLLIIVPMEFENKLYRLHLYVGNL